MQILNKEIGNATGFKVAAIRKFLIWHIALFIILGVIGFFFGGIASFLTSMMVMVIIMFYFLDLVSEGITLSREYGEFKTFQNRFFNYFIVVNILDQKDEYKQFCEKLRIVGCSWLLLLGYNFLGIAIWVLSGQ